jgi:serine/threonine protein kinase/tetratricopeptide (TPR) repeat protein
MNADPNSAKAIFLEAVERYAPEQWPAFLDRACAGQPELRGRVEVLLEAHREAGTAPHRGGAEDAAPVAHAAGAAECPGHVVGPYKLLQRIGEGGMGAVWMAEQLQPVQRKVALKIIKAGMDSRQVLARFEAERQALALMDHPNIAKVHDGGSTDTGRPYFVMELVKGQPITRYCDEHRLTPRQRLELFIPVCQAIQHAHQKGIIHRDVKPSNVLVAPYDGQPVVKVIDFGIAKATGQRLTEKTLFTEFGAVVGTLEYMSPEQAELNNQDIDTRSDIYSLGVLLYELLTGTTPLNRARLKQVGFMEVLRRIREEEPPRPSTRLSESKDTLPSISAQRQMEPAKLTKLVRGELDWIVMKALEKNRNRRYETANGFAMDVQRYLADEPVHAGPPSAAYRFRKFARRNKAALTTVALVAAALLLGMAVSIWQAVRAIAAEESARLELAERKQQQQRAEVNLDVGRQAIDEAHTAWARLLQEHPHMQEWAMKFNRHALTFYEKFARQNVGNPRVRRGVAQAHYQIGQIQRELGLQEQAAAAFREALARFKELEDEEPKNHFHRLQRARSSRRLGSVLIDLGQPRQAEAAFRTAIALERKLLDEEPRETACLLDLGHSLRKLGWMLGNEGKLEEAKQHLDEAIAYQKKALDRKPGDAECRDFLLGSYQALAQIFEQLGRPEEALKTAGVQYRMALELDRDVPGTFGYKYSLALSLALQGNYQYKRGRLTEAMAAYDKSHQFITRLNESFPSVPHYQDLRAQLESARGKVFLITGRHADAEKACRQALQWGTALVKTHPRIPGYQETVAYIQEDLGSMLSEIGTNPEAEKLIRAAVANWEALSKRYPANVGHRHRVANNLTNLAVVEIRAGRLPAAEATCRRALTLYHELLPQAPNPSIRNGAAWCYLNWGHVMRFTRRPREAEKAYRKGLDFAEEVSRRHPGEPMYERALLVNLTGWADMLDELGRRRDADKVYQRAVARAERLFKDHPDFPDHPRYLAVAASNWGVLLKYQGRLEEAKKVTLRALEVGQALIDRLPNVPGCRQQLVKTWRNHGELLAKDRMVPEADKAYRQALAHAKELLRQAPSIPYIAELATCHRELAQFLRDTGNLPESEREVRKALKLQRELLEKEPGNPGRRHTVCDVQIDLGHVLTLARKLPEAGKMLEGALVMARALVADFGNPKDREILAGAHFSRGNWHRTSSAYPEAEKDYREALRVHEELRARFPDYPPKYANAARVTNDALVMLLHGTGRPRDAIDQYEAMIRKHPAEVHYRDKLAQYLAQEGMKRVRERKPAEALPLITRAAALLEGLVKESREDADYRLLWAGSLSNLGLVLEMTGDAARAVDAMRRAVEVQRGLLKQFGNTTISSKFRLAMQPAGPTDGPPKTPVKFTYGDQLALGYGMLAAMLRDSHRLEESLRVRREATEQFPDNAELHNNLAWQLVTLPDSKLRDPYEAVRVAKKAVALKKDDGHYWNTLGVAHYYAGEWHPTLAALTQAMKLRKGGDGNDWFFLAMAHEKLGNKAEARRWYDRALEWMQKHQPENAELRRFQVEAAEVLGLAKTPKKQPAK